MDNAPIDPSTAPSLAQVMALQAAMQALPQVDLSVEHHLTDGAYGRHLFMPAGAALVGKLHKTRHLLVVSGDITIINGGVRERITGFRVLHTEPGTKRAIVAHADSHLMTFHVTTETDLSAIEAQVIAPDPAPALESDA